MVTDTQTASARAATSLPAQVQVAIIGAGFGGMGAAIKLEEAGFSDFIVFDKGAEVGGTWRDNTYPGAACDVPSQLYSFSFAINKEWSRSFSAQPEIQAYLRQVAAQSGVLDRFRFGVTVEEAAWDDAEGHWLLHTSAGAIRAQFLVSATGALSEPRLPDIDGIETFAGEVFHSARWNHDFDLTGKKVAVIGTGASAIQIIPEIAPKVAHLDVYQRTAPWVIPRWDRTYSGLERAALRHIPGLQKLYRSTIYWGRELFVPAFTRWHWLATPARMAAEANIRRGIKDPQLRQAVTPTFAIGCKRILISNDYYPALARPNVELVTDSIQEITPTGVVTSDGTSRDVDVLVVATGFYTTDIPITHHIKGRDGATMADTWAHSGMSAYKGTTVAGFPNFFFLVGPNTGLGHSSMVFMIESQLNYLVSAMRHLQQHRLSKFEPRRSAQAAWNDDLQARMGRTVWNAGGCASWYLDEHGRNTTLWPRATFTFRQLLRRFDPEQYLLSRTDAAVKEPAA